MTRKAMLAEAEALRADARKAAEDIQRARLEAAGAAEKERERISGMVAGIAEAMDDTSPVRRALEAVAVLIEAAP